MRGDRERCLDAGMNSYVCKPIRPEVLFREICSYTQPLGLPAIGRASSAGPAAESTVTERQ